MNCPSRTDQNTLSNPHWNQQPCSLSPDLTTREDLNGISNAREHRDETGLTGNSWAFLEKVKGIAQSNGDPGIRPRRAKGASLTLSGPPVARTIPGSWLSKLRSAAIWLFSVFCAAGIMSHRNPWAYFMSGPVQHAHMVPIQPEPSYLKETGPVKDNARITHKRGSCASGGVQGDYNTPLHVGALFVILGTSTLACAFPILATNFPRLRIPPSFLFVVSHFGTGVLVATAFVHLLPEAFTSLGDPCLSAFWTSDYTAMPGAIALGGIFLITVIEMVFSPARHTCRGGLAPQVHENGAHGSERTVQGQEVHSTARVSPGLQECPHLRDLGPVLGRSSSMSRSLARVRGEDGDAVSELSPDGVREEPTNKEKLEPVPVDTERNDSVALSPEQKRKTEVMQVFLLEMGILFHSVFIGMSLSVTVGSKFVVLLIAITFHQAFEGLALGSRIASLNWPKRAIQPWLMSLAYGCTTPIGQAIGLATHTLYSPESETGLLLVGSMNAISAGLLVFASLVELMAQDFLSDESWKVLRGRKRVYACLLVFSGAFLMSLVGAWA